MNTGRILVASAGAETRKEVRAGLQFEGYHVAEVEAAGQTVAEACSGAHDVLLLDARTEGVAPFQVCRAIRPQSNLGIIVFNGEAQQVLIDVLNAGADDCVAAPLLVPELLARVRAFLRRFVRRREGGEIVLQDRTIDLKTHRIRDPIGREVHLTPKEFSVLECLIAHANKPLAHQSLAQQVWQRDGQGEVEYLRFVIKQLRSKLEPDPSQPRYILTERSFGYRFQIHPAEAVARSRCRVVNSPRRPPRAERSDSLARAR
jgi:two-component system, OmpR family, KDP operon response regulator KdpE